MSLLLVSRPGHEQKVNTSQPGQEEEATGDTTTTGDTHRGQLTGHTAGTGDTYTKTPKRVRVK